MKPSPAQAIDQRLAGIVETAMDAVVVIDAQQRIVLFNEAATRMFQRTAQQTLGQPLEVLIPAAYRHRHRGHVQHFADTEAPARPMGGARALVGLRSDGSEFPIEASISRDGSGDELLMTVLVRDVSEVRAAERKREAHAAADAANLAKNDFLSRMSHELRTPLNAVLGMAQLLRATLDARLSPGERQQFETLQAAGHELRTLIDHVLDLSQLETGQTLAALQDIDLCHELDQALSPLATLAAAQQVRIEQPYRALCPLRVRSDPARLRQLVTHLVSNGIKYNRPGGWVRLSAARAPHGTELCIADNGIGMNAAQLASLYEPFNRLGRERSGVPGAGIGLALARHLVTLMGGRMTIDSTPNVGTEARLFLPDAQLQPAGTVLYIEDNPVNALLVVEVLRAWPDVRVVVAETGTTGLAQARSLQPDLVLLDMHLPDMTGLEVLARLRGDDATRTLRVVSLSANAMQQDADQALAAGACAYWTKPIDFGPFLDNLRGLLRAS